MIEKSGSIPALFKAILFPLKAKPLIGIAKVAKPSFPGAPDRVATERERVACPPTAHALSRSRPCLATERPDTGQCRIWLNEAQREIDRLRRSIATTPKPIVPSCAKDEPTDPIASPPTARRLYAVDPIGKPPPPRDPLPATSAVAKVVTRPHVTNIGSALDVLV